MKYVVSELRISLDEYNNYELLKKAACKRLNISDSLPLSSRIIKQSIDARRKTNICLVNSVMLDLPDGVKAADGKNISIVKNPAIKPIITGNEFLKLRPLIVGSGPAGMFAGIILAQAGFMPIIIERGAPVEERNIIVDKYWKEGILNTKTNVQFGEGGAGTFSDGKLTTRINDPRAARVLAEYHENGAHESILYKAKPHIGSDVLKKVVINMRKKFLSCGGEIRFNSKLTSLIIKDGRLKGAVVNDYDEISAQVIVLAIGHSARDTFYMLYNNGVKMIAKPFSAGVRIEHPQRLIDEAQYGYAAGHPALGAADYQLFCKTGGRTVYSFCMCPGGVVTASASEQESIVTNGMSDFTRNGENANSALVVSVSPEDFSTNHPLAGIEFQRTYERQAFFVAGSNNSAPVQRLEDFLNAVPSKSIGEVRPSYTGTVSLANLSECLPNFVVKGLKEGIRVFDGKLRGYAIKDALLTGVETRTSSPVRISRGDTLEAEGIEGLYPAGEGAGYAGGIVSAAVDGIRVAEQIIRRYKPY